jgi:hypothetical protein
MLVSIHKKLRSIPKERKINKLNTPFVINRILKSGLEFVNNRRF